MSKERRGKIRVAADAPARIVEAGTEATGTVANFSENGIFLRAGISPKLHRPVHVQFILKPDHTVCSASGKVAWCAPHGIGVVFDEVNDGFLTFVQHLATAAQAISETPKRELISRIMGEIDVDIGE